MERSTILDIVKACLDDVLALQGKAGPVTEVSALIGPGALLDSLGLVTLIVDVEQKIADDLGASVTLADDRAMSATSSPFRTVGNLADHALARVVEAKGARR